MLGETKKAYKISIIFCEKSYHKRTFPDLGIDEDNIKLDLRDICMKIGTGFI
jgi:hypothetical protein